MFRTASELSAQLASLLGRGPGPAAALQSLREAVAASEAGPTLYMYTVYVVLRIYICARSWLPPRQVRCIYVYSVYSVYKAASLRPLHLLTPYNPPRPLPHLAAPLRPSFTPHKSPPPFPCPPLTTFILTTFTLTILHLTLRLQVSRAGLRTGSGSLRRSWHPLRHAPHARRRCSPSSSPPPPPPPPPPCCTVHSRHSTGMKPT